MLNTLIRIYLRFVAIFKVAVQRLLAQRGLALATLLGLVVAIALVVSIPLYSEAIQYRMLTEGLFSDNPRYRGTRLRPPVALVFRYVGSFQGPQQWEGVQPLARFFSEEVHDYLHLPPSPLNPGARMYNTGLFGFFPAHEADIVTVETPDIQVGLACMEDPQTHLTMIDGTLPPAQAATSEGPIEVAVSRFLATKIGIQPGEEFLAYDIRAQRRFEDDPARLKLRVVGVWEPSDPRAEFWEYSQLPLDNVIFVSEETFANRISPALSDEIYQAMWYLPLDASRIYVGDVPNLLLRIEYLKRGVAQYLPGTTLDLSPVKVLERYQENTHVLTLVLLAFSVPIVSLILTFIILVVALTVERQRSQVATLRSRGATVPQVTAVALLESGLLGLVAFALALPLALLLAYTIGQTRSFLDFSLAEDLRVGLTWATARYGLVALLLTLAVQVLPILGTARHTVVTYKMERARRLRPPWWQRVGVDFLLLIPAIYGTYVLQQQGSLVQADTLATADPLHDPLLFLVPALALLALALLVLRLLPLLMRAIAWLARFTHSVGLLLAARQLARAPGLYTAPLALLILTLGLSTYTATLAATLDRHLHDQHHYWVGAELSLVDSGEAVGEEGVTAAPVEADINYWRFLPVSEYLKLPGITAAARVGRYEARVKTPDGYQPGTFIGVDRTDFAKVAFWRDDFAAEPLGTLMNRLATTANGVLLPQDFMKHHVINVGDQVHLIVRAYNEATPMAAVVVGSFDYFPSWYPETGPLVVGNLEYFYWTSQIQYPYRVWFRTSPEIDYTQLSEDLWEMNLGAQAVVASRQRILREQRQPERQGLFGLLSVGFSAAAVLTALGFILYTLFSFRRRAVEMGVLRATGLSARHLAAFVAWELAFLLITGSVAGTGLGIWASKVFVPYLQIGGDMIDQVPPFVISTAWPALTRIYLLFALLFVIALVILVRQLLRMKLFQAIKLGETI